MTIQKTHEKHKWVNCRVTIFNYLSVCAHLYVHVCVCHKAWESYRTTSGVSFQVSFILLCLKYLFIFSFCMWVIGLHICLYTGHRGQERPSDPLNWKRADCDPACGSGDRTRVLCKVKKCSLNLRAISTALPSCFLRQGLSLAWSLANRLSQLTSVP